MVHDTSGLLNSHEWYRLVSAWDYVRALIWCSTNLITAFSYLAIPAEIQLWKAVLPFQSASLIARLFIWFITLCGLSHIVMIVIMPTAPWWGMPIFMAMSCVSLMTVILIRRHRSFIINALTAISSALEAK